MEPHFLLAPQVVNGDINEDEDETNKPGAGAVEMKFFTTVNVTAVKLFGTATRGEKVGRPFVTNLKIVITNKKTVSTVQMLD